MGAVVEKIQATAATWEIHAFLAGKAQIQATSRFQRLRHRLQGARGIVAVFQIVMLTTESIWPRYRSIVGANSSGAQIT